MASSKLDLLVERVPELGQRLRDGAGRDVGLRRQRQIGDRVGYPLRAVRAQLRVDQEDRQDPLRKPEGGCLRLGLLLQARHLHGSCRS